MPHPDDSLMLSILKDIRVELRDHRTLLLQLADGLRRHDRRFNDMERRLGDLSAELELMVKSELMGRLTHFETQIDEKLAQLSDRLQAIETAK
ncbi:MAG: hypothetical protein WAL59_23310 [Roseiarcus sp.]